MTDSPRQVARVPIGTTSGEFDVRAFECSSGLVHLALVKGDIGDGRSVLTRVHSECLTGDALGSLRCDCGIQLRAALRAIAAEGRGVLVYATGHEGRGIGLVNKLKAYMLQHEGADTVDANVGLGLPVDARDYTESAGVLGAVGVRSVRLLTNNPSKADALIRAGIAVEATVPIATSPHVRNLAYLETKRQRMGHVAPAGPAPAPLEEQWPSPESAQAAVDVRGLLGDVRERPDRPYVLVKYAQTLDGRIATATGDSRWISGEEERRVSHALRASCDAVMVGVGTVVADDPHLTVRMVAGASPVRVVVDSTLRIPLDSNVLDEGPPTVLITTQRSRPAVRFALQARGAGVRVVPPGPSGVDLRAALEMLREMGMRSLLVEGGSRLITAMLAAGLVDRLVVSIAPKVIGEGTAAVGDLGVRRVHEGLGLTNRSVHVVGADVMVAGDVAASEAVRASDAPPAGTGSTPAASA